MSWKQIHRHSTTCVMVCVSLQNSGKLWDLNWARADSQTWKWMVWKRFVNWSCLWCFSYNNVYIVLNCMRHLYGVENIWVLTLLDETGRGGVWDWCRKRCQYDTLSPLSPTKTLQLKALKLHLLIHCITTDAWNLTWLFCHYALSFVWTKAWSYDTIPEAVSVLFFSEVFSGLEQLSVRNKWIATF